MKKKNSVIMFAISLPVVIFLYFSLLYNPEVQIINRTSYEDVEAQFEEVCDDFSMKINDIDLLVNDNINGIVYFGRDTCPICLHINKFLKQEFSKNNKILLNKFDTDQWRENEKFKIILEKYNIIQVPTLIKINEDKSYESLSFSSYEDDDVEAQLKEFLYGKN